MPKFDVKSIRPTSSVIIAGPFDTEEEAKMWAIKYGLDFQKWCQAKHKELEEADFDDELDRKVAERDLKKFIKDNTTLYEVVPHKRGGI